MVKKSRPIQGAEQTAVTVERAARLYRMLHLLAGGAPNRAVLMRRLKLDVRGFYRDLELLRASGIIVEAQSRRYHLRSALDEALSRLPLPDPRLTLGECFVLARGRSPAHRKLRDHLNRIMGSKPATRSR
jgi:predicted DNA-binding transcriptional regulator YafY